MTKAVLVLLTIPSLWAASVCLPCHPKQTEAYSRSPMGNAIGLPMAVPHAAFTHLKSKTRFEVLGKDENVRHQIERGGLSAEHPVAYRIGSGNHAEGFLARVGEWLFQSPVAKYKRLDLWDVAPGYESMTHPDFNRRVSGECLACHSSGAIDDLQPISCEQCHGPSQEHLQHPARNNIQNPSRLSPEARDAVCEQCHLTGEARIDSPSGISIAVYDRPREDLRVVSHVEQLAMSECARQSQGRLWCGSCHQPHGDRIDVDTQCRNCHAAALPVSHDGRKQCVGCHMPKRVAIDGGHTAFTDHRIQRQAAAPSEKTLPRLRLWREVGDVALRERNLGLASIVVGEREGRPDLINDGYRRLAAVFSSWPRDPEVLSSLGMVLFLKDQKKDALKLLEAAVQQRPGDAALHEKLALVRRADSNLSGAIQSLEKSISLDPGRESAYFFLAECQTTPAGRKQVLNRLLKVFPQSLIAREALGNSTRP